MTTPIDVLAAGRHLIHTASGARYVVDASDPDDAPTITRLTHQAAGPGPGFRLADMRRDSDPVRVIAVQHLHDGELLNGVVVGQNMWLTLEALAHWADATVRRSTPVTQIERLPDDDAELGDA